MPSKPWGCRSSAILRPVRSVPVAGEGGHRLKRMALATAMAVVAANVWTGSPLFALWVGSRIQGSGPPKMSSIFVVAIVLAILSFALVRLLGALQVAYDDLTGQGTTVRQHTPWLRSMRGEREQYEGEKPRLTAAERILVAMVLVAVLLFEIWFFFFSSSPIDQRSGRSQLVPPPPTTPIGV